MPARAVSAILAFAFATLGRAEFALWRKKQFGTTVPKAAGSDDGKKNVLHIVINGMRPEAHTAYSRDYMITPTLDRLAKDAITFDRAYTQTPSWSTSRRSFLTGLRPDSQRLRTLQDETEAPTESSLLDFFKNEGYTVHMNNETEDHERVIEVAGQCLGARKIQGTRACLVDNMEEIHEYHSANKFIAQLQQVKNSNNPFYFLMNIRQPLRNRHIHRSFWDLYPSEGQFKPAARQEHMSPLYAGDPWGGNLVSPDIKEVEETQGQNKEVIHHAQRLARKAYYALLTQADAHIGRVLRALEAFGLASKTLVVVHSDHGSQLGEAGLWEPALLEPSLRVPLLISAPWRPKSVGRHSTELVELVDLRRTLPLLAGLPKSKAPEDSHDFSPVFDLHGASTKAVAMSQLMGCLASEPNAKKLQVIHAAGPVAARRQCRHLGDVPPQLVMGYSLRVDGYRYTEWRRMDPDVLVPDWAGKPVHVELYQLDDRHVNDFDLGSEGKELSKDEDHEDIVEKLHEILLDMAPSEEQVRLADEFQKVVKEQRQPHVWDELLGVYLNGDIRDEERLQAEKEL